MSNAQCARCVGVLAVALGIGVAASAVESPARGGPDSKAELGVVSSGGSTSSTGAGSVEAGSGSDESLGPDQAATATTEVQAAPIADVTPTVAIAPMRTRPVEKWIGSTA